MRPAMDMHSEGVIFQTHSAELVRRLERSHPPFLLVDVRPVEAFARGHIDGAVRMGPDELAAALPEGTTPATEFIVTGSGPGDPAVRRAALALRDRGARRCVELTGGMLEWRQMGLPVAA